MCMRRRVRLRTRPVGPAGSGPDQRWCPRSRQQIALVERLTALVSGAPGNPPPPARIWVLLTEAPDGGWGLWGSAHTNDELIAAARSQMAAAAEAAQAAHNGEAPDA